MKFIIYSADKPDSLHIRQANRDAHLAWLKSNNPDVSLLSAGPWLDDEEVMRGSMLIVESESKAVVEAWLENDPYKKAGLPDKVMVKAFIWAIGAPE